MSGIETMTTLPESVRAREQYLHPGDVKMDIKNCGDDRVEACIQMFGGALGVGYTAAVLREAVEPGSVQDVSDVVEEAVAKLGENGVENLFVHSDEAAEGGMEYLLDSDALVGCAFAKLRSAISSLISENPERMIQRAAQWFPEVFAGESAFGYGKQVIAAHGRLAGRDGAIPSGRDMERRAIKAGAQTNVFRGSHDKAAIGLILTDANKQFDSASARSDGRPTYVHNLAASNELLRYVDRTHSDEQALIATAIDLAAIFEALGVQEVHVY